MAWMKHFQGNSRRACDGCGPRAGAGYPLAFCTIVLGFLQGQGAYYLGRKTLQGGCLMCESAFVVHSKCRQGLRRLQVRTGFLRFLRFLALSPGSPGLPCPLLDVQDLHSLLSRGFA